MLAVPLDFGAVGVAALVNALEPSDLVARNPGMRESPSLAASRRASASGILGGSGAGAGLGAGRCRGFLPWPKWIFLPGS